MKNKLAAWIALGLIAVVAAALLATTNEVTKDVIEQQNVVAMQDAWRELLPGAEFPEGTLAAQSETGVPESYVYAGEENGGTVGYVAQTTVQGYGGPIDVIVGTDTEGTITGINVGGASFAETAGLGAKAQDAAFTDQFRGKVAPLTIGENIDAITAATITSSAVVRGANGAIDEIAKVAGFTVDKPQAEAGQIGDGRYAATAPGFAGPVYVEIQLDDQNTITEIVIGDDKFAETSGYGAKAQEPAFYDQFIGKTGQLTLGTDVDAISGATITSAAVVDAVNTAMLYATDPEAAAAQAAAAGSFELPEVPDGALTESASRKGYGGPVTATITIDPDTHELLRVEFGDDQWAETDGLGSRIKDDAFWQQFIGKTLPIAEGDIDLISGATVTSQAAFEAVNKAYDKLFPSEGGAETPAATAAPADPNTARASSKGYGGPVAAEITVDEAGALTGVTFGDATFVETDGLGSKILEDGFAAQFVGKTPPLTNSDIDIIAGATVTSDAAIAAVNKAYDRVLEARAVGAGESDAPAPTEPQPEATVYVKTIRPAQDAPAETPAPVTKTIAAPGAQATTTAEASSKGYGGPIYVKIAVDDQDTITNITIGDDTFAETDGLGTKVLDAAFADQFIGKTLPLAEGDADLISGATVSSEAVIAAINKAYDKVLLARCETEGEETAPAEAEASAKGYGGPVTVTITVADGKLTALTIHEDTFAETQGLGSKVLEDAFTGQFAGRALPIAEGDADLVSGATVSSEAVIAAINKAYDKLLAQ